MHLSSQGLNFLGLTVRKYETANVNNRSLNAVHKKLEAFEEVSNGLAQTTVALSNLKDLNSQAYCIVDGKKLPISEKSWDRGGILEGKVPLEEGIAKGLYHIEGILSKPTSQADDENLDEVLKSLKEQVISDAASQEAPIPQAPSQEKTEIHEKKFRSKFDVKKESSFKFIS